MEQVIEKLIEVLVTKDSVWAGIFVVFLIGFARYFLIPVRDSHTNTNSRLAAAGEQTAVDIAVIKSDVKEIKEKAVCRAASIQPAAIH